MRATSRTVRASGHTWATSSLPPAAGCIGTRPKVGFRPTSPQKLAGMRIEPAPSEPSASGANPAATAAAPPPVDPPGVRVRSHGLRDSPNRALSVEPRQANSGRLVRPTKIAPAARSPRDARGILGRDELRQQARAERGPLAGGPEVVLDRHGNAVERAERPAGHHRLLGGARVGQRPLGVDEDVGAQPRVQSLDALQHGAGDLDRRQRPATDQRGQLDGGREAEVGRVHVSASRLRSAAAIRRGVNGWRPAVQRRAAPARRRRRWRSPPRRPSRRPRPCPSCRAACSGLAARGARPRTMARVRRIGMA